jgi:hypothetical protein
MLSWGGRYKRETSGEGGSRIEVGEEVKGGAGWAGWAGWAGLGTWPEYLGTWQD